MGELDAATAAARDAGIPDDLIEAVRRSDGNVYAYDPVAEGIGWFVRGCAGVEIWTSTIAYQLKGGAPYPKVERWPMEKKLEVFRSAGDQDRAEFADRIETLFEVRHSVVHGIGAKSTDGLRLRTGLRDRANPTEPEFELFDRARLVNLAEEARTLWGDLQSWLSSPPLTSRGARPLLGAPRPTEEAAEAMLRLAVVPAGVDPAQVARNQLGCLFEDRVVNLPCNLAHRCWEWRTNGGPRSALTRAELPAKGVFAGERLVVRRAGRIDVGAAFLVGDREDDVGARHDMPGEIVDNGRAPPEFEGSDVSWRSSHHVGERPPFPRVEFGAIAVTSLDGE
jgi:hypothetical protein